MKVTISFKHLEHTESLDEKIKDKCEHLAKYLDGQTEIKWTCYANSGVHCSEVKLIGPTFDFHATAKDSSLYKTLDQAIAKLEKQLVKKKDKWKDRIHHKHKDIPKNAEVPEAPEASFEDDYFDEAYYKKSV